MRNFLFITAFIAAAVFTSCAPGQNGTAPAAPSGFAADPAFGDGLHLSWDPVAGATSYSVYRKTGSGSWTLISQPNVASYIDTTVTTGPATYDYEITASNAAGESSPSATRRVVYSTQTVDNGGDDSDIIGYDNATNRGKLFGAVGCAGNDAQSNPFGSSGSSFPRGRIKSLSVYTDGSGSTVVVGIWTTIWEGEAAAPTPASSMTLPISAAGWTVPQVMDLPWDHDTLYAMRTGGDGAISYCSGAPHDSLYPNGTSPESFAQDPYRRGYKLEVLVGSVL